MIGKHTNFKYDSSIPYFVGDRRYGQDIIRDWWSTLSYIGSVMQGLCDNDSFLFSGGDLSEGSSGVDIGEIFGIVLTQVEIPDDFSSLPPDVTTEDISIPFYSAALSNVSLSSATLDGATTNYIKVAYDFTDGNTRSRAKKSGSYAYEGQPTISVTIDSTAPTDYELSIGTVVGTSTSSYTLTEVGYRSDFNSRIATNTSNISSNDSDIATNASNISDNASDISTNADNITAITQFDYVVDSSAKFQALCAGSVSGMTSVLVKAGTWSATSGTYWDLDDTDTKKVVGESGAILSGAVSNSALLVHASGLDQTNPSEYSITGVAVVNTASSASAVRGFDYCDNLIDCHVTVTNSAGPAIGYNYCDKLVNCYSDVTATGSIATGIYNCDHVTNCITDTESTDNDANGFWACDYVTNCVATVTAGVDGRGFRVCDYVSNCKSTVSGTDDIYGFDDCERVSNCLTDSTSDDAVGFMECIRISNCEATATGTTRGRAFQGCTCASNCKGTATGTTSYGFIDCNYVYAPLASGGTSDFSNTNGVQDNNVLS